MEAIGWDPYSYSGTIHLWVRAGAQPWQPKVRGFGLTLEAKALSFPPGEYKGNFETQTSRRPWRTAVKHVV